MTNASIDDLAVELIHWPRDRQRREALAKAGVPRVLLVPEGEVPPTRIGVGEDWIRVPADERDLYARARRVSRHMAQATAERAVVDAGGVLRRGPQSVTLSVAEAEVMTALLEAPGTVVGRAALEQVVWPDGAPSSRSLDALVYRLRRRVAPLGLVVAASRGRGFLVDGGAPPPDPTSPT